MIAKYRNTQKTNALAHGLRLQFLPFESDLQLIRQWINVSNAQNQNKKRV